MGGGRRERRAVRGIAIDVHLDAVKLDALHPAAAPAAGEATSRTVRRLTARAQRPAAQNAHVVVLPGMGALGYLTPLLRWVARQGVACSLLDLPGFGTRSPRPCAPTVRAIGRTAAAWLLGRPAGERIVLVGHSTGAQAAARAAALIAAERAVARAAALERLVLAAPTFAPNQRTMPRMALRLPLAFRRDSPAELRVLPDYLRAGTDALRLLRSGLDDRVEETLRSVAVPVTLTAGTADALVPSWWLHRLAGATGGAQPARIAMLPGSHNNPFTHPASAARVVLQGVGRLSSGHTD
jgi:alpha-beta hydrolase superfamily lysophospholipase